MKDLVVILGAGASAGVVEPGNTSGHGHTPPITKEIFQPRYDSISNLYPDVKTLSAGLTNELDSGATLEAFLKRKIGSVATYDSLSHHRKGQLNQFPAY